MAQYDPKVIYEFAERLYNKANTIIASYVLTGALLGGIVSYIITRVANGGVGLFIVFIALGAIGGYFIGKEKVFMLKLQAQTALCQVRIEENTRK